MIEITAHPQSVNTTLNSTVTFICEADADEIYFIVNNISASDENVVSRGFHQQGAYCLNGTKKRDLLAQALLDNNNTNISCRAVNSNITYSDIAVLRIQGELML